MIIYNEGIESSTRKNTYVDKYFKKFLLFIRISKKRLFYLRNNFIENIMKINGNNVTEKVLSEIKSREISKTSFSKSMGMSLPTFYVRVKAGDWSLNEINMISEMFSIPTYELLGLADNG